MIRNLRLYDIQYLLHFTFPTIVVKTGCKKRRMDLLIEVFLMEKE